MQSEDGKKWCPQCERSYPATSDYFYAKDGTKDGLDCYCKTCSKAIAKRCADVKMAGAEQRRAEFIASGKLKHCNMCGNDLAPEANFYHNGRTQTGFETYCKQCCKEKNRVRYSDETGPVPKPAPIVKRVASVDCEFICGTCGMGADMDGNPFPTQAEADACCIDAPAMQPASSARTYDNMPTTRDHNKYKYDGWVRANRVSLRSYTIGGTQKTIPFT